MSIAPHVLVAARLDDVSTGDHVPIAAATLHHLRRVLRLADGAVLSLTDGRGRVGDGVLDAAGARLTSEVRASAERPPRIVLAQALSKGRRAEEAVRVACELGVDRIVPVVAERTQGRPDARAGAALVERWQAVAAAALEQSRGAHLAAIDAPVEGLGAVGGAPGGLRLIAVPDAEALPDVLAVADPRAPDEVIVAVGPEGGWSPTEVERALADGWRAVGLGPTVLRTEHAGPVAVAVAAALVGRWRSAPAA